MKVATTAAGTSHAETTVSIYDANGNLLAETDALGHTSTYAYNGLNEVTAKTTC